jgi:hypothetical protein
LNHQPTDSSDSKPRPTFAFFCGPQSLSEYYQYRRVVEKLQARRSRVRFVLALLCCVVAFGTFVVPSFGYGETLLAAAAFWYLLEPTLEIPSMNWWRTEIELMGTGTDYFVIDDGIWLRSEVDERTIPWSEIALAVDAPVGVLFCDYRLRPIAWIPDRAFFVNGTRNDLLAIASGRRVKIGRFSGS